MSVLDVKNVSIRYRTGNYKNVGLKEYVIHRLKREYKVIDFWANKDICFSLEKGDMLGIIGTNGAGKSTLLKAVSGIMEPTAGSVHADGTVVALLELGSGFDKELTVKENIYLRGAMLGYTRKFMDETYDGIIDFAELVEFQDRPFKQLSSGMKSRLAFAIASLIKPDILILDEVLAVGDGGFRHKSEAKMRDIIENGATTILVSHSIAQIKKMCNKVLWLNKGEQVEFGSDVEGICNRYLEFLAGPEKKRQGDIIKYDRGRIVAAIMTKTGWDYEETVKKIEEARKKFGITYTLYASQGFHYVPMEQQEKHYQQLFEILAKNKEHCVTKTMEKTGWSREFAEQQVTNARERLDILFKDYIQYEFYKLTIEQQGERYREILEERRRKK